MKLIVSPKDITESDVSVGCSLYIIGETWQSRYILKEIHPDKIVIHQLGKASKDILYTKRWKHQNYDVYLLDREKDVEYFL